MAREDPGALMAHRLPSLCRKESKYMRMHQLQVGVSSTTFSQKSSRCTIARKRPVSGCPVGTKSNCNLIPVRMHRVCESHRTLKPNRAAHETCASVYNCYFSAKLWLCTQSVHTVSEHEGILVMQGFNSDCTNYAGSGIPCRRGSCRRLELCPWAEIVRGKHSGPRLVARAMPAPNLPTHKHQRYGTILPSLLLHYRLWARP